MALWPTIDDADDHRRMTDLTFLGRRRMLLAAISNAIVFATSVRPALSDAPFSALTSYERASGGRVGLLAENVASGAKLAWRADERFVMCSTFKASLAALTLARVDRGEESLAAMVRFRNDDLLPYAPVARANLARGAMSVADMAKAAVELSDNTCANLLLARAGGPPALTAFWRASGDEVSRLDHDEPLLNRSAPGDPHDTTTPIAMAANLRRFAIGDILSPASRTMLVGWLVGCRTGANRLRAGLPPDWRIGDKTGNNGADASSDIAVAWPRSDAPVIIAVYTQGGTPTPAQSADLFAEIGHAVARRLV